MNRTIRVFAGSLSMAAVMMMTASRCGAQSAAPTATTDQLLASAASEQKHTFLVFHKDNGPLAQAMADTVRRGVESRSDRATVAFVNVTNPQEAALVTRLGVDRAPMPLTLVLAPNGAVTGAYPQKISDEHIAGSFATPGLAECLKSLQNGKLVFVCFQPRAATGVPQGVQEFQADPQFQPRVALVPVRIDDPAEADFLAQLKIDPASQQGTTAFFAPPGMLVGTFAESASMDEIATALHKAGKCCNDPNCKHNKAQPAPPAAENQNQASQRGTTTRN